MSARELVVLGSSSQVPTRHRNQCGYYLRWDAEGLLFDPGEGTQRQMIQAGVPASAITRVLITHFHGDHCLGLPGVVQRLALDRVERPIQVHFPASGRVYFDRLRQASIFRGGVRLEPRPVDREGQLARWGRLRLEARRLDHGVETWGYRIQEEEGRTLLAERLAEAGVQGAAIGELVREGSLEIGDRTLALEEVSLPRPGQSMAFVMDSRPCPGALELARGVDLLVCESTYLSAERELARKMGHMTAAEAARLAREAGARTLVLGHFSQRHPDVRAFLEEARAIHPDVVAAEDGARVPVPRRSRPTSADETS